MYSNLSTCRKLSTKSLKLPSGNLQEMQKEFLANLSQIHRIAEAAGQEALRCSGLGWYPKSDISVSLSREKPFQIQLVGFKRIDIALNPNALAVRVMELLKRDPSRNPMMIVENTVGSLVRLFAGYYSYCPWDVWRHRQLVRAATWGAYGTYWVSDQNKMYATACALFFERSIVARRLTEMEGALFVEGIVQERFINAHQPNLLSNLFSRTQSMALPKSWEKILNTFPIELDPIAEAILPEVMEILFDGRVRMKRGQQVLRGKTHIPYSMEWVARVERLSKVLVPYLHELNDNPNRPPNPLGQPGQGPPSPGDSPFPGSDPQAFDPGDDPNPFAGDSGEGRDPNDSRLGPGESQWGNGAGTMGQSHGGVRRGRRGARPAYNDLAAIDAYYSEKARHIVIKGDENDEINEKKPENLVIGYLDYEDASFLDLMSGDIDWYRTRVTEPSEDNPLGLQLFRRCEPIEIPARNDEPASQEFPSLLLIVDSSSSMGFQFKEGGPAGGKYDLVLLATWGMLAHFKDAEGDAKACAINFSDNTRSSGWHPASQLNPVKAALAMYQGGGTTLDPGVVREAIHNQDGKKLTVIITDGGLGNTDSALAPFQESANADNPVVLLHVGKDTQFTQGIRKLGGQVHLLASADDLVGMCIDIAEDTYVSKV